MAYETIKHNIQNDLIASENPCVSTSLLRHLEEYYNSSLLRHYLKEYYNLNPKEVICQADIIKESTIQEH